jgi:putative DNA primase/helicase
VERDGKVTKPPFQPNGRPASHSDPSTWSSFDAVRRAYDRGGWGAVGFVLDGKPHFDGRYLHALDWDDSVTEGVVDRVVGATVAEIGLDRVEVSVSGTGLRGFFLHDAAIPSRRTTIERRSVELYSNKRFVTTTGRECEVTACL